MLLILGNEIKIRLKEEEDKEWDFKLKEQQDSIDLQKSVIKAARDVGVAYGNKQPKTVTYNTRSWW